MVTEAIILAGGLGTRLRSKVKVLPKVMAPINNIPFLSYQLSYLSKYRIQVVYLAVGYLSESIVEYFGDSFKGMQLKYVYEKEPLGTGGAIVQALEQTQSNEVLVCNGDTKFNVDLFQFYSRFVADKADFSMALKPMKNFDRYGTVHVNDQNVVVGFEEKKQCDSGNINGGVYLLNKAQILNISFPEKFSFETNFLETEYQNLKFTGFISEGYFLDIGIPEDYEKAQTEFKPFEKDVYDKSWTLFLDRDGVINVRNVTGYITHVNDFIFIDGVKEAIEKLSRIFGRIVVVTNQQCIGKKIITSEELEVIHAYMIKEVESSGGRIDKIYYAPNLHAENSIYRKPNPGMADLAQADFPEIDFNKSIIVGDSVSDMQFGLSKNMRTVFISSEANNTFDFCYVSLKDFADAL